MCAQYGINVVDTNIVPVKIDFEYSDTDNPFKITGVKSVNVPTINSGIIRNPGRWNGGKHAIKAKRMFSTPATISSEEVDKLAKI